MDPGGRPNPPPAVHPELRLVDTAFGVYDRELDYIFATLNRLGADAQDIEDLAQAVFELLLSHWPTQHGSRPIRVYLFGLAFRAVRIHCKRAGKAVSAETRSMLMAQLDGMPLRRRAVLIMHDLDGFSIADIARSLSITQLGARLRLQRARKELLAAIGRMSSEPATAYVATSA